MRYKNCIWVALVWISALVWVPPAYSFSSADGRNADAFTGFHADRGRGADPDRIDGSYSRLSSLDGVEIPLPFRFITLVQLSDGKLDGLTLCGEKLKTEATQYYQSEKLSAPFQSAAEEIITASGANLIDSGNMLFAIKWFVADVKESLSRDAKTNFCLVRTEVSLAKHYLINPETGFDQLQRIYDHGLLLRPAEAPLFQQRNMYFVSPDKLRDVMDVELKENMDQVLPTVTGEITDACGYFSPEPQKDCERYFRRTLLNKEEELRCASSQSERDLLLKEVDEINSKLSKLPKPAGRSIYQAPAKKLCP